MAMLISVADAKAQIQLDNTLNDTWLALAIPAISGAIIAWVGENSRVAAVDSNGDFVVDSDGIVVDTNPVVQLAVAVELATQFRFREGAAEQNQGAWFMQGYVLNMSSTALLTPLRLPRVT